MFRKVRECVSHPNRTQIDLVVDYLLTMIASSGNGDRWPSSALTRLASTVQLRPAAPSFQIFPDPHNQNLSQSVTKKLYRGAAEVCLNHSAYSPKLAESGNPRKSLTKWKPIETSVREKFKPSEQR